MERKKQNTDGKIGMRNDSYDRRAQLVMDMSCLLAFFIVVLLIALAFIAVAE